MRALSKSAAAGLMAAALVGAGAGAAYASSVDSSVVDTTAPTGSVTVAAGSSAAFTINLTVTGQQAGTATFEVYRDWRLAGGVFTGGNPTQFTVPPRDARDPATTFTTTGAVTVAAGQGSGDFTLAVPAFDITNSNSTGAKLGAGRASTYTVTVAGAPANTAPSPPGAPVASASPTQGGFSLSWAASSDTEGNAVTYTLEGKDADDSGFSPVASGLTTPSYGFAAGTPAQGTWTYRVKAVEATTSPALQSGWSVGSQPVVVDRTVPNAPSASADRAAEYSGTTGDWWKDSVTVSFAGNGDPALPDTSAGSGVASVTGAQTFATTGAFTAQGTATDNVELTSSVTSFSGSVDATAPEVSLQCPTSVVKGSTAYATWTASDLGSGLATATSGQIALDTSAVGSRSVSAPVGTAVDNVGHASAATAPCTYSVVYDFRGFFQPVDMDRMNVAKAGSAIPIKFSLNGFQGLDIIAAGSPTFTITGTSQNGDAIEEVVTATAGGSSLSYDADSDQYVYVWKTSKDWAGKSGTFTLKLNDGTSHTAKFSFKK